MKNKFDFFFLENNCKKEILPEQRSCFIIFAKQKSLLIKFTVEKIEKAQNTKWTQGIFR